MGNSENGAIHHAIRGAMARAVPKAVARVAPKMARKIRWGYVPEGAKRRYPAHFVSKLTDADGELQETRHWLGRSLDYGYISEATVKILEGRCDRVGGMLGKMIQQPEDFS